MPKVKGNKSKKLDKNKPKPDWTCVCGRKSDLTVLEELQMAKGKRKRCPCGRLVKLSYDAWERIYKER